MYMYGFADAPNKQLILYVISKDFIWNNKLFIHRAESYTRLTLNKIWNLDRGATKMFGWLGNVQLCYALCRISLPIFL
jgi:hypothetical protein